MLSPFRKCLSTRPCASSSTNTLINSEREVFSYYANQQWEAGYITHENFTKFEQLGKEEWNTFRVNDYDQLAWEEGLDW
jgi:AAA+ superfamily predicted ATPase